MSSVADSDRPPTYNQALSASREKLQNQPARKKLDFFHFSIGLNPC